MGKKCFLYQGNNIDILINMAAGSVHTVITSPPYYGVRSYGIPAVWWGADKCSSPELHVKSGDGFCLLCGSWLGTLGNEPTVDLYIEHLCLVFDQVRRVLHPSGTVWVNLDSSYARSAGCARKKGDPTTYHGSKPRGIELEGTRRPPLGYKPKDMIPVPWLFGIAMLERGWWLRSDIIWRKLAPMPNSHKDRPTKAHEYILLFSKSQNYFCDMDAIREPAVAAGDTRHLRTDTAQTAANGRGGNGETRRDTGNPQATTKNKRSVWAVGPQNYKGAHFATYPPNLVKPCVRAGASQYGVCPECGAPWERVTRNLFVPQQDVSPERGMKGAPGQKAWGMDGTPRGANEIVTLGWRPTCKHFDHHYDTLPMARNQRKKAQQLAQYDLWQRRARRRPLTSILKHKLRRPVVLDVFVGSGTTGLPALEWGAHFVGIDASAEYLVMARERLGKSDTVKRDGWENGKAKQAEPSDIDTLPLFAKGAINKR